MFAWDETKRQANLIKHKLDFADAALVFDNPAKLTRRSWRHGEERNADIALVESMGACLTLVYVRREHKIRIISFRTASRMERRLLAGARQSN